MESGEQHPIKAFFTANDRDAVSVKEEPYTRRTLIRDEMTLSGVSRLSHGAKVKRGQLNAVQQGRYGTGPAPYGYRRGVEGEKPLIVDDREAEVVRMIFREYLQTRSTGKVVSALHSRGIMTRKGNKWSRQAISIILSNRTYRGRVTYGDIETQGLHDPIIEPALFYKANALRDRKRRKRHNHRASS